MLFKHKRLLEELLKRGRRATAEIVAIKSVGKGSSIRALWASIRALWAPRENMTSGWIDCLMRLWIISEQRDQSPFDAMALAGRSAG